MNELERARGVVARLVRECAWHREQTHTSLLRYLVEESAEFIDVVDQSLGAAEAREELGDVLYQVLFHAEIAGRDGEGYDLESVAAGLSEKLVRRHPHVFGERGAMSAEELDAEWERLKEDAAGQRRGSRGVFDGVPAAMPTLARATKIAERLRRAEIDAEALLAETASTTKAHGTGQVCGAEAEQQAEQQAARSTPLGTHAERELGAELMRLVVAAERNGIDADRALRVTLHELQRRAST